MSRYLTPSKTTLLLLITVYLEGAVPTSSTVPVLSFIVTNLLSAKQVACTPLTLLDFERVLSAYTAVVTGRTVWDLLLKKLWSIDSSDTYHAFFDTLHQLHSGPRSVRDPADGQEPFPEHRGTKLSRASPLGSFVRRAQVEFTRLTFGDSILLWKDFVAFRQPSFKASQKRNASLSRASFDTNLADIDNERIQDILYGNVDSPRTTSGFYSTDDVERLLDFQVSSMSKTGQRLPEEVERQLEAMAKSQVTIPSAVHYVKFLDAWKAGDYPTALDCLHRYFDYTIQTREKSHYQYALLNMALLHAHFGCHAEAISAMQETVSTARENKDLVCLNYSLSWLFHFGQSHPEDARQIQESGVLGNGKEALAFLRGKAKENGSWTLLSSTLVAEARLTILAGDGLAPAVENLVKASHINLTKRVTAGFASLLAVESVLWTRLGASELAETKNELFLECYQDSSTDQEKTGALCRVAWALAARGRHSDAMQIMEKIPLGTARNLKTQISWSIQAGLLKLQHAMHRNDLTAADNYLTQLQAIPMAGIESDHRWIIVGLHVKLHIKRGNLREAMSLLETSSKDLDSMAADIANRVRLMVLKATVWDKAGKPQKGFSVALRACSIAYEARLLIALSDAVTALCRILNSLCEFKAARDLLLSCMPQSLVIPDRECSANAYAVLADAQMGLAGKAGKGSLKRKEEMSKCLEYLDRAFDDFSAIEHVAGQCEMLAKRATVLHLGGDYVLANDIAAKYLNIMDQSREEVGAQ